MGEANVDLSLVTNVLGRYSKNDVGSLIEILHDVQSEYRYLPGEALDLVAGHLSVTPAHVFGVATFYEGFHLEPRGKYICTVCMGTACHVRGAPRLLEQMERDLEIERGCTTEDLKYTLEEVACVGACALGPLIIVNDKYHGNMTSSGLTKMVKRLKKGEEG